MEELTNRAEQKECYVVVVDNIGRKLIGKAHVESAKDLVHAPGMLLYNPAGIAESIQGDRVQFQIAPLDPQHGMDYMCVQWSAIYDATSKPVVNAYEDFWMKYKAVKAGIIPATQMPDRNTNARDPGRLGPMLVRR